MEIGKPLQKVQVYVKKYKYPILVLIVGVIIMLLPLDLTTRKGANDNHIKSESAEVSLEEQISKILSQVEGVGEVQVLLTVASGEEILYQVDQDVSQGDDSSNVKSNTVTVTDEKRNQNGIIRQVNPVTYQGAIVVCKGADNPNVQLAIIDAVSKSTGLGANKISVLKMH